MEPVGFGTISFPERALMGGCSWQLSLKASGSLEYFVV